MTYVASSQCPHLSAFKAIVVLGLLSIFQFCDSHSNLEESPCGVLYSLTNYSGLNYTVNDNYQSTNLQEELGTDGAGWSTTGSLKIETGCSMEVCNGTYFEGTCQKLVSGSYPVTTRMEMDKIKSARCVCTKECKCSDIRMKRSSCARAYLEGGCSTCHALYMDLDRSNNELRPYFPYKFADKVQAFRIRSGCTLTVFSEEDFEGEEEIFDEQVVENYNGTIGSLECECNDDNYVPPPPTPRSPAYPPLVDIPESLDEVMKALSFEKNAKHPGLQAALKSLQNRKSSKNAYILVLGTTGAGKSSAINILFDNPNITIVDSCSSGTYIHEYRILVPVDELGVANSELRIIDTPGFGDTRGLDQDSKFLATLDSFLSNHEELKDRIPNIVLIFHKYNDNRFNGDGGQFVKMLRAFDSFRERIIDENYSNVIFVLSHFCSETKANKRKPETRLKRFKEVIQDFSLFPKPTLITVAENKAKDQELPMVNGYFMLPNAEYYPRNLFEKMELVTQNGGDLIGQGVFRTAFRNSEDFNVSASAIKMVDNDSSNKFKYYLRLVSNAKIPVKKTEISQILQLVWDEKVDVKLRRQFPFSLYNLQKSLNIRNISTKVDIPRTSTAILELLTALTQDEATRTLLETALNIKPPAFPQDAIAGFGYNVFTDAYIPKSPFKLGDVQQSDIGSLVPKILTCKLEHGSKENIRIFENEEQYLEHRVKSLGIEGTIARESFTGVRKPGHNIKELSFKNDSCSLSATREFRLFEFALSEEDLTEEFMGAVKKLPTFNESDHSNVETWKDFFTEYGTHVVKSIYGGGAIEIKLHSNRSLNSEFVQTFFDLIKFVEETTLANMIYDGMEENGGSGRSNKTVLREEGIDHSLTFVGGDAAFHISDLNQISLENASKLLTKWKKSLKFNPVILNTEMKLIPISRIVRRIGLNYTAEIDRATALLFKSELKYVPRKPNREPGPGGVLGSPGPARQDTPFLSEMLKHQQLANQKIQEMILGMKKMEVEMNERRRQEMEERRLEWERLKYRDYLEYKRNEEALREKTEDERQKYLRDVEVARHEQEATRLLHQQEHQKQLMEAQSAASRQKVEMMMRMMKILKNRNGGDFATKKL